MIPEEKIREIKDSVDIVEIISEVVLLRNAGRNLLGLCPFHAEKTPSFTVSREKQVFHCFGCGTGGNVFSFIMKKEGLSFPEAAKSLARKGGIDLPEEELSPEERRRIAEREALFSLNRDAMRFFRSSLRKDPSGGRGGEYLKKRGLTEDIIDRFQLGYAPAGWENLSRFLQKKGVAQSLGLKSGLIVPGKDRSSAYDRFRDRIIFPILDTNEQVVGFGGRSIDGSLPKYMNSPETPVFSKSRTLYGFYRARQKCREKETVFIVEGYFDLLALHQQGIENSVATLGTSLSTAHLRLLKGHAARVILVFDSDEAGLKAAQRSAGLFMNENMEARIMVLPQGYDPDSFIFEFGCSDFMKAAENASGIMPFLTESAIRTHGLSIEGKVRVISDLKDILAGIEDGVVRALHIKELAERVGIEEGAVLEKIRQTVAAKASAKGVLKPGGASPSGSGAVSPKTGSENRIERRIVAMMLHFPEVLPEIERRNLVTLFEDQTLKTVGEMILTRGRRLSSGESGRKESFVSDFISGIDDGEKRDLLARLAMDDDAWSRKGCLMLINQFESSRKRKKDDLLHRIKTAEESDNRELLLELLAEKQRRVSKKETQNL